MRMFWIISGIMGLSLAAVGAKSQDDASKPEFYTGSVKQILETNCYQCHGGENHRGGLSMVTRESMLKGGRHGAAIVPGNPSTSMLITRIRQEGGDDAAPMPPPPRPKLTDEQIAIVERWVKAGAVMP